MASSRSDGTSSVRSGGWSPGVLYAALGAFSAEVWLGRATDEALWTRDVLLELAAALAFGGVVGMVIRRVPRWAARLLVGLFPATVTLGSGVYLAHGESTSVLWTLPIPLLATLAVLLPVFDPMNPRHAWLLGVGAVAAWSPVAWLSLGAWPPILLAIITLAGMAVGAVAGLPRAGPVVAATAAVGLSVLPGRWYDAMPAWQPAHAAGAEQPDLVLVVVDTLRADAGPGMRTFRQLAREGRAWSAVQGASTWTLASLASIHTGRPVSEHHAGRVPGGAENDRVPIAAEIPTLAEQLAARGYDTAAVVAENPNASATFGFQRGFSWFDYDGRAEQRYVLPRATDRHARPVAAQVLRTAVRRLPWPWLRARLAYGRREDAETIVDRALRVVQRRSDRPLFLWLHLMDVHLPYRHVDEDDEVSQTTRNALFNAVRTDLVGDPIWEHPTRRSEVRLAYAHEVQRVDAALERLLDSLGPPPPHGRVVVLTADHGEEFWEHGGVEHGHALWQEVIGVPLVVSGIDPTRLRPATDVVGHTDIVPTLLALAGTSGPPDPVGLLGPARDLPYATQNLLHGEHDGRAVRLGALKLVDHDGLALYDLLADPLEQSPRADRPAWSTLEGLLPTGGPTGQPVSISDEERQALEALGYTAGPSPDDQ